MCRLAALPPGSTPSQAYDLLKSLEQNNKDGVGVGYFKDGVPVAKKYPVSVTEALKGKLDLFSHMPHDGWTIIHTRLGTHGDQLERNTHPFIIGDYIFCHNGVWSDSALARVVLDEVKWQGETDSEVAGYLMNKWGPEKFADRIKSGGVFMGIHSSGELHIVKNYGDLEIVAYDKGDSSEHPEGRVVLASEFLSSDIKSEARHCELGVWKFLADGKVKKMCGTREKWNGKTYDWGRHQRGGRTSSDEEFEMYSSYAAARSYNSSPCQTVIPFSSIGSKQNKKVVERSLNLWSLDPDDFELAIIDPS